MTYFLGLGLSVLLVAVLLLLLAWGRARQLLWLIVLTRYSVIIGALLLALYYVGVGLAPSLLGNAFVLEKPFQMFNVTLLSFMVALMVLVTFRVIQLNAPDRFPEYGAKAATLATPRAGWGWRWALFVLLGAPLPVLCLVTTWPELDPKSDPPAAYLVLALAGGAAAAVALLALLTALQQRFLSPAVLAPGLLPFETLAWFRKLHQTKVPWVIDRLGVWWAARLNGFGPGYAAVQGAGADERLRLRPGHAQMILCTAVLVVAYAARYAWFRATDTVPTSAHGESALYDILVILLVGGLMMSGLTFFLDYYRVPVEVAVLLLSLVLWNVNDADHFYPLEKGDDTPPLLLEDLYRPGGARPLPSVANAAPEKGDDAESRKTLVIVTAPGGGIHAAAWAAQVLVGLHARYENDPHYRQSLGLISAVSGGSVGTMYYLDGWGPGAANGADPLPEPARQGALDRCMESSLEATAWGTAHSDLLRVIFPPLAGPTWDRGQAIEQAWALRMRDRGATLRGWRQRVRDGKLPAAAFNATLAETGQRLVLSPVQLSTADEGEKQSEAGREFFTLYPGRDLKISTAARLSATFPFVSPIARPMGPDGEPEGEKDKGYHVADGGYVDNEGLFTALMWIQHLIEKVPAGKRRPFDRVIVIRIQPFPEEPADKAKPRTGWEYSLAGPLVTIQQVRTTSQTERNDLGADMLGRERWSGVRVVVVGPLRYADPDEKADQDKNDTKATIPLSWKLTSRQKDKIRRAWEKIDKDAGKDAPLKRLDKYFKKRRG